MSCSSGTLDSPNPPAATTLILRRSLDPEFALRKCPLSIAVLGKPCVRVPREGIMALWPVMPRGHLVANWLRINHAAFDAPTVLLHDSDSSAERASSPGLVTLPRQDLDAIWHDLTSEHKSALCGFLETSSCSSRTVIVQPADNTT